MQHRPCGATSNHGKPVIWGRGSPAGNEEGPDVWGQTREGQTREGQTCGARRLGPDGWGQTREGQTGKVGK
jgi:hypothetical protein